MSKKPTVELVPKSEPAEHTPTPEEAKEMFRDNPGLSSVMTTEGMKARTDLT